MERWAILALAGHWGGFLRGADSTMKNRPGIKGKLFLKTTTPTVFTCPHSRPRAILFSNTKQGERLVSAS